MLRFVSTYKNLRIALILEITISAGKDYRLYLKFYSPTQPTQDRPHFRIRLCNKNMKFKLNKCLYIYIYIDFNIFSIL